MSGELGQEIADLLDEHIGLTPDFPEPGVLFRDISPLVANGPVFAKLVRLLAERYEGQVDAVAGLESRGFILGAPVAAELGVGMITVRKAGKLPGEVYGVDYALEYGTARIEIQPSLVAKGQRVLILDDVLATGGTASAAVELLRYCGAEVAGLTVLLELEEFNGRLQLPGIRVESALLV
ncbi:adenine phosphoribosyltransferase [Schaalia sp. ZJ1691]|uniref:adenine phosphoribosyltransferase n=1 Tax=Schaalia sp. ZJ1691 TaxID=2709404 RepID=UPI0013ED09CF|nr:adenine phosphoribosyltransferase [Schaalia sp. ZJ1691]